MQSSPKVCIEVVIPAGRIGCGSLTIHMVIAEPLDKWPATTAGPQEAKVIAGDLSAILTPGSSVMISGRKSFARESLFHVLTQKFCG